MTEKRFNFVGGYLYDGNKPIGHVEDIKFRQDYEDIINALHEENVKLKQRNNRQAKQLDRLYHLIEEKDWRTLSDILDDFKRCEEQLQKEWRTYGDVE